MSLIHKQDSGTAGDVNHFTLGYAYNRKWGAWEFDGEAALQRGRAENKDQDAWAYHLQLFYRTDPKTRLMFETNAASGGSDANTIRTFDNLYPTNHKFYGVMDLHAWKNLNMFAFGVSHQLRKDLDLKFRWSTSSLRDDRDAWYGAGGGANRTGTVAFRDLSGASGRDLGREFDFEATWKKSPRESIAVGLAWFVPGSFVKRVSGDDRAQVFGFVMYSLKF